MVLELANSAVSDGFVIVHAMVDGLDDAQVREDGLEIFIGHLREKPPWHDGANLPRAYLARPHDPQEHGFVVITDTGRIRRQIRTGHLEIRSCNSDLRLRSQVRGASYDSRLEVYGTIGRHQAEPDTRLALSA